MAEFTTQISSQIEMDVAGNIFLTRYENVLKDGVPWQTSPPDRQPISATQTQGYDAFNAPGGVPALVDLATLAGDKWAAMQAMQASASAS